MSNSTNTEKDLIPLVAPLNTLNYIHQDQKLIDKQMTTTQAYQLMTSNVPLWLDTAFKTRDFLSKWLGGIQSIKGFEGSAKPLKVGDKADFFDVVKVSDDELFLKSTDKHLSVLVALQIKNHDDLRNEFRIATSVVTYNFFGRVYMLPVSMEHGFIVRSMLDKLEPI